MNAINGKEYHQMTNQNQAEAQGKAAVNVTCPHCGKESAYEMWTLINTDQHPEMKQAVRDRSAFVFKCPECGEETPLDYGFVYQQPDLRIMIQYETDPAKADRLEELLSDISNPTVKNLRGANYLFRLVRTANQLADKLAIFDADFDDRIVEIYKLTLLAALRREHPEYDPADGEMIFFKDDDGEYKFQIMQGDQNFGTIGFNESAYEKIANDLVGIMCDIRQELPVVNRQTAVDLMKIISDR